jgi:hypothetical protein
MIDEASRKLALVAAARGRAANLRRTVAFHPPDDPLGEVTGHPTS